MPQLAAGQQCHGESWLTLCFAGLSPNACPDMVLGYPFLENSVSHSGLSVVERPGKMCPVPPPNGCSQSRQGFSRCFSGAPHSPSLPIPPALRGSRSKGRSALPGALIQGTRAVTNTVKSSQTSQCPRCYFLSVSPAVINGKTLKAERDQRACLLGEEGSGGAGEKVP